MKRLAILTFLVLLVATGIYLLTSLNQRLEDKQDQPHNLGREAKSPVQVGKDIPVAPPPANTPPPMFPPPATSSGSAMEMLRSRKGFENYRETSPEPSAPVSVSKPKPKPMSPAHRHTDNSSGNYGNSEWVIIPGGSSKIEPSVPHPTDPPPPK